MNAYSSIDKTIHQLTQTLAKFNRSFVTAKEDDSHTNLAFDSLGERIVGRWAKSSQGDVLMSLHLTKFQFEILNKDRDIVAVFPIESRTQAAIEKDIQSTVDELGLNPNDFIKPLHFEIPKYEFAEEPFSEWKNDDLVQWMEIRTEANIACQFLLGNLQLEGEVRIWPHHFDTGIYVESNDKLGLGFGLAMKDDLLNAPYYYYSGYALNDASLDFSDMKTLKNGKWIIQEDWKGAGLSLEEVPEEAIADFILEVTDGYFTTID